jgi:SAM-dependent methyltransferase
MYGTGEHFTYGECAGCGSLTLLDLPDDLAPYYPPDYLSMTTDPAALSAPVRTAIRLVSKSLLRGNGTVAASARTVVPARQLRTLVTILQSVARVPGDRPSSILDVGAGSGMVPVAIAAAGGFDVVGIDPFAAASRRLGDHAELRAVGLDAVDGNYDLVMLHHSLEHVPDPVATLQQAAARLKPGGTVLVRVPTVSSYAWREYGVDWVQLDPPRHVWLPSRDGLARAATLAGLELVSSYDDASEFQFWGSEQVRRGVVLMAADSQFRDAKASPFSRSELAGWRKRSDELNRVGDGDQVVVYLHVAG